LALTKESSARAGITLDLIAKEYARLAFAEIQQVLTWDHERGQIRPSAELSPQTLAAIAEVTETDTKTGRRLIKVKLYSKQAALDSLTRYLQMLDLEARVKALEEDESLTPPGAIISLSQHACESDAHIHRRVQKVLGRSTQENDHVLVIVLQHFGFTCPPGKHTHEEDAKIWRD